MSNGAEAPGQTGLFYSAIYKALLRLTSSRSRLSEDKTVQSTSFMFMYLRMLGFPVDLFCTNGVKYRIFRIPIFSKVRRTC